MSEPSVKIHRDVLQQIALAQGIKLDPEDLNIFFESRGWLALQQRLASLMNAAYTNLENINTNDERLRFWQGFLAAAKFMQNSEADLNEAAKHEAQRPTDHRAETKAETEEIDLLAILEGL